MARRRKVAMARAWAMPTAVASTKSPASATAVSIVADQVGGGPAIARPVPMATRSEPVPTMA